MNVFIYSLDSKMEKFNGKSYKFKGARCQINWPMEHGAFLGEAGIWNYLWRLGFHPSILKGAEILAQASNGDLIFVCATTELENHDIECLQTCLARGITIISSGYAEAWNFIINNPETYYFENPYGALAYIIGNRNISIIAPPGWDYMHLQNSDNNYTAIGCIAAIHGERQTPNRALVSKLGAPAIIKKNNFYYLNGNPFAAFQSWLQGQESLLPWLNWRHRMFWLDEWVSDISGILESIGVFSLQESRPGIKGLSKTTIVLRHDLDSSRDTSYLEEEMARELVAVYAILIDDNTSFWVDYLNKIPEFETAFHYNTCMNSAFKDIYYRIFHRSDLPYLPNYNSVTRKGLLHQVNLAKRKGINAKTLHRHASFLIYPEWIDAMDEVLNNIESLTGSSSLFRGQVLRWGVDRVDNIRGYVGDFPDAQYPLWFPFRVAHAGYCGKILRGWETTSLIEPEPELVQSLIDYHIPYLSQRVITLNYHPAHANHKTFVKTGSISSFKKLLDIIQERQIPVELLQTVYNKANVSLSGGNNKYVTK
jgi:hypothetical protein